MRIGRGWISVVLAAVIGATACVEPRPSEADAQAMVDSMSRTALLQPPTGSKVVTTRKEVCSDSTAPFVERAFAGSTFASTSDVEDLYRQRMVQDEWRDIRDVPAGGMGATKGDRTVHVVVTGQGAWNVFMQQGDQPTLCSDS